MLFLQVWRHSVEGFPYVISVPIRRWGHPAVLTHDGPTAQAFLNSYSLDFISRTSAEERTAMYDQAAAMDEAAAAAAAEAPL